MGCEIIDYINGKNVLVKFDDGSQKWVSYRNFKLGSIQSDLNKQIKNLDREKKLEKIEKEKLEREQLRLKHVR